MAVLGLVWFGWWMVSFLYVAVEVIGLVERSLFFLYVHCFFFFNLIVLSFISCSFLVISNFFILQSLFLVILQFLLSPLLFVLQLLFLNV